MALKGFYIIEMQEKHPCTAAVGRACARLESDNEIIAAARDRKKYSKSDAWWSIPAGIMMILTFILYSLGWKIGALILVGVMAAYVAAMFIRMGVKKSRLKRIDNEISPQRAAEALFRMALRLPPRERDITRLVAGDGADVFSTALRGTLTAKARECGIEPESWALSVRTEISGMESSARDVITLPLQADITARGAAGECRFSVEYAASFACASTGDCLPVDISPVVACVTSAGANPAFRGIKKCPHCGCAQSAAALKQRENACMNCGGKVE